MDAVLSQYLKLLPMPWRQNEKSRVIPLATLNCRIDVLNVVRVGEKQDASCLPQLRQPRKHRRRKEPLDGFRATTPRLDQFVNLVKEHNAAVQLHDLSEDLIRSLGDEVDTLVEKLRRRNLDEGPA